MPFTGEEIAYLRSQLLARLATLAPDGWQPDVVPVACEFDGEPAGDSWYETRRTVHRSG
ncbi:hypothetical protein [Thermoactinospora rubra]|uniref:hypothetical protein n=1 Tax=Thermoactinospora rubra TaxID=1088767 RepID=UPI001981154F|nr:hypothetical protein [Thermoactinospora rubra]